MPLVYTDKFKVSQEESEEEEGAVSEFGDRLVKNEKSSNRFHARWLDMMYPRLRLAKDLLREDGVIFISIDDNEMANLREICDEVFGGDNFIGTIEWNSTKSVTNTALISVGHTHNLVFAKSKEYFVKNRGHFRIPESGEGFSNPDNDKRGPWKADPFQVEGERPDQLYPVTNPNTGEVYRPNPGCSWKNAKAKFDTLIAEDRIIFGSAGNSGPQRKRFLSEALERGKVPKTWRDDLSTTTNATSKLKKMMGGKLFTNPKPVELVREFLTLGDHSRSGIILDFFSGSGTTAEAVIQLNSEDGGNRRYIMIQIPAALEVDSPAATSGYSSIAQIGKDRIRRSGDNITAELRAKHADLKAKGKLDQETNPYILDPDSLDIGFKSFRIEDTKINWLKKDLRGEDIVAEAGLTTQDALDFVPGFTDTDIVYELMLRQSNIPLTLPITQPVDGASRTYLYGDSYLICLEEEISKERVESLAALEPTPLKYFFRDSAFGKDIALKDETFRRLNAEIAKNTADQADAYTVEFI